MEQLLRNLDACRDAQVWAKGKTWKEIFKTCHRGDWLLWFFYHTNGDRRLLTLVKGHCANTVRHLMKDERSTKAVDAAIAFGNGKITAEELRQFVKPATDAAYAAADAAYAAAGAAYATAADATDAAAGAAYAATAATDAAYAAYAAATAAADATYTAAYATDAAAGAAAYAYARKKNQQLTADICRKYLPIEVWNISENGELITITKT